MRLHHHCIVSTRLCLLYHTLLLEDYEFYDTDSRAIIL